ncbi:transposase family protein [Streptomyces vinaceus]|uniref:transposase family protein n=1 Tax=Streptomyces vinaceus TaxID=1960 RepID=UPI003809B89F
MDTWYSAKHKAFGANVQFLSGPDGTPLWVSDAEPSSVPDITAARAHCLSALYKASADGLPTLADADYQSAGTSIHHPFKKPRDGFHLQLHPDTRTYTRSCGEYGRWVNGPRPSSRNAGAPSSTSPSAQVASLPSPKPPSSSTMPGDDLR